MGRGYNGKGPKICIEVCLLCQLKFCQLLVDLSKIYKKREKQLLQEILFKNAADPISRFERLHLLTGVSGLTDVWLGLPAGLYSIS